MKKLFLFAVVVFTLCGCTNNQLIGTWQAASSEEDGRLSIAVGGVQTFTFESNGDYHSNVEIQAKLGENSSTASVEIKGTWEMVDDNHYRVKTTKAIISEEEMDNITDEMYTIISLNDEALETMNKGQKKLYRRIK